MLTSKAVLVTSNESESLQYLFETAGTHSLSMKVLHSCAFGLPTLVSGVSECFPKEVHRFPIASVTYEFQPAIYFHSASRLNSFPRRPHPELAAVRSSGFSPQALRKKKKKPATCMACRNHQVGVPHRCKRGEEAFDAKEAGIDQCAHGHPEVLALQSASLPCKSFFA